MIIIASIAMSVAMSVAMSALEKDPVTRNLQTVELMNRHHMSSW